VHVICDMMVCFCILSRCLLNFEIPDSRVTVPETLSCSWVLWSRQKWSWRKILWFWTKKVLAISKHCLIGTIPPCSICCQLWFYGFAMPGIGAEQSSRTHKTPIPPKQKAQGDVCCFGGVGVVCLQFPELPPVLKIIRLQDHQHKKGTDTFLDSSATWRSVERVANNPNHTKMKRR
jgi:hypothetical protein